MDDKDAELRQDHGGRESFTDAAHNARPWIEADRNIRAGGARRLDNALVVGTEAVGLGDKPQRRCRVGRAAAEPGAGRQPLEKHKTAQPEALDPLGEGPGGAQHKVVGQRPGPGRHRARHFEINSFARPQC